MEPTVIAATMLFIFMLMLKHQFLFMDGEERRASGWAKGVLKRNVAHLFYLHKDL